MFLDRANWIIVIHWRCGLWPIIFCYVFYFKKVQIHKCKWSESFYCFIKEAWISLSIFLFLKLLYLSLQFDNFYDRRDIINLINQSHLCFKWKKSACCREFNFRNDTIGDIVKCAYFPGEGECFVLRKFTVELDRQTRICVTKIEGDIRRSFWLQISCDPPFFFARK